MNVSIGEHKVGTHEYMLMAAKMFLGRYWPLLALPVMVCVGLAAWNTNFLYVAAMVAFLVLPMAQLLVFYKYTLYKEVSFSILLKRLTLTDEGVEINYVSENEENPARPSERLPWERFACVTPNKSHVLLIFRQPKFCFLAIPYSAFGNPADLREAMNLITSHIEYRG
ncbi:MAG: hypothetical protein HUK12_04580 [Muribaculaceae bacterium]|nr:hypothetical protein [Muribaculaceae bacterium]